MGNADNKPIILLLLLLLFFLGENVVLALEGMGKKRQLKPGKKPKGEE